MTASKAAHASVAVRRAKGDIKRTRIVEAIGAGRRLKDAIAEAEITKATYYQWRKQYPEFRDACNSARSGQWNEHRRYAISDFGLFRHTYLDHESPPFHMRAVYELEHMDEGEILLMLWPPEHGKTSLVEDYATFAIVRDPAVRITVGSEKKLHAEKVLGQVRRRFEDDTHAFKLMADYGPFRDKGSVWRDDAFRVRKAPGTERDFTMAAIGIDGALQGTRADYLIIDDIQGTRSMNRTDVILNRLRQDWFSRSGAFGRIVIVGTRVAPDDVYEKMLEENIIDRVLKFPAYKTAEDDWPEPDRQCFQPKKNAKNLEAARKVTTFLWPERYEPKHYLTMRINAGESAWTRNFMQASGGKGSGPFSSSMLDAASLPMVRVIDNPPADMSAVAIGLDPGFGTNAIMAVGMGANRMRLLSWRVDHGLENNQQVLALIESYAQRYIDRNRGAYIDTVMIEDKAYQKGLINDEGLRQMKAAYNFRVTGHQTGVNKYDHDFGVAAMAASFERGEIELPGADDPTTKAAREVLDHQLLGWRPYRRGTKLTQDLTMALWFCWMVWRKRKDHLDGQRPNTPNWTVQGLPWRPTDVGLLVPSTERSR